MNGNSVNKAFCFTKRGSRVFFRLKKEEDERFWNNAKLLRRLKENGSNDRLQVSRKV